MKRNVSLEEISDGRLYGLHDMVKAGCNDCRGCSSCCKGMGSSVVLDPLDSYRLTTGLKLSFQELLIEHAELHVADGVILPSLKMSGKEESCSFLNSQGRCSVHELRPGICRLFPLGRYYENGEFRYFLQKDECRNKNRTKVKVSKWIDTPNLKQNQKFIVQWHYFLNKVEELLRDNEDDTFAKNLNMYVLNLFYVRAYEAEREFYEQFDERLKEAEELLDQ